MCRWKVELERTSWRGMSVESGGKGGGCGRWAVIGRAEAQ